MKTNIFCHHSKSKKKDFVKFETKSFLGKHFFHPRFYFISEIAIVVQLFGRLGQDFRFCLACNFFFLFATAGRKFYSLLMLVLGAKLLQTDNNGSQKERWVSLQTHYFFTPTHSLSLALSLALSHSVSHDHKQLPYHSLPCQCSRAHFVRHARTLASLSLSFTHTHPLTLTISPVAKKTNNEFCNDGGSPAAKNLQPYNGFGCCKALSFLSFFSSIEIFFVILSFSVAFF